jgi:hypothetical protein
MSKDFDIVKAIFEHPACADVKEVWFPVGDRYGYNALQRTEKGRWNLMVTQASDEIYLPSPDQETPDDAFVVLLMDAALMRKLNSVLSPPE